MWADALLEAERAFLLRFAIWGGCSVALAVALLLVLRGRLRTSPLVLHFGVQTLVWGTVALTVGLLARPRASLRDFDGARELHALLGTTIALDIGLVLLGATLACAGWLLGRRLGVVGAGAAMLVQGTAWLVIQMQFAGYVGAGL